jgi:hypothetical protein
MKQKKLRNKMKRNEKNYVFQTLVLLLSDAEKTPRIYVRRQIVLKNDTTHAKMTEPKTFLKRSYFFNLSYLCVAPYFENLATT